MLIAKIIALLLTIIYIAMLVETEEDVAVRRCLMLLMVAQGYVTYILFTANLR